MACYVLLIVCPCRSCTTSPVINFVFELFLIAYEISISAEPLQCMLGLECELWMWLRALNVKRELGICPRFSGALKSSFLHTEIQSNLLKNHRY